MVWKREICLKVFIFCGLFVFFVALSFFLNYIKYDNKSLVEYSALVQENQLLKKELNELKVVTYKDYLIGKVVLRNIYGFYDEMVINLGSDDGVTLNDAVVNEKGLIGIVSTVNKKSSNIKLLSGDYNISVKVGDSYGNLNKGIINMIDKYSNVNLGDLVYTSGLDDVPKGIYVGKVICVKEDIEGLGKEVVIEYVDNTYLNYISVIGKVK